MQLTKPEIETVYVTFMDAKTRKSVSTTVYGVTHEEAKEDYERYIESLERGGSDRAPRRRERQTA